jgi:hypothetical protein
MKFLISRTSTCGDEEISPCDGAFRDKFTWTDVRVFDDPAKIPAYASRPDAWYGYGTNHRVVNGRIMRDYEQEDWFIEIADLPALVEFMNTNGRLVLMPVDEGGNPPEIEIYDDYRE